MYMHISIHISVRLYYTKGVFKNRQGLPAFPNISVCWRSPCLADQGGHKAGMRLCIAVFMVSVNLLIAHCKIKLNS